jgi:hypothetical protein
MDVEDPNNEEEEQRHRQRQIDLERRTERHAQEAVDGAKVKELEDLKRRYAELKEEKERLQGEERQHQIDLERERLSELQNRVDRRRKDEVERLTERHAHEAVVAAKNNELEDLKRRYAEQQEEKERLQGEEARRIRAETIAATRRMAEAELAAANAKLEAERQEVERLNLELATEKKRAQQVPHQARVSQSSVSRSHLNTDLPPVSLFDNVPGLSNVSPMTANSALFLSTAYSHDNDQSAMSTYYSTVDRYSPQRSAHRAAKEEEALSEAKERTSNHSNKRKGTVADSADVTPWAELESPSPVSYAAAPTFIRDDDSSQEGKDAASPASFPLSFSSHFLDRPFTTGEPSEAIQFNSAPDEDSDSDDASSDEDKKPKAKTSITKKKTSRGGQKSKSSAKLPATPKKTKAKAARRPSELDFDSESMTVTSRRSSARIRAQKLTPGK